MTYTIFDDPISSSDQYNAVNILLDATDDSKLDFLSKQDQIEAAIAQKKKLFFEFQFGMDSITHNFKDQMAFFGYSIGITTFINTVYEKYRDHVEGVFLYRGAGDFRKAIESHLELRELREDFCRGLSGDLAHFEYVFSIQILMEYLHRLAAALDDELSLHVLLNLKGISSASKQAEMLAAYTFPYIKPAVKGAQIPHNGLGWEKGRSQVGYVGSSIENYSLTDVANVAILLPELGRVPYSDLDAEIAKLNESGVSYKIIPEDMLNQSWHLIDDLMVFEELVSSEGKRMIDGFIAAGGRVKKMGDLSETALSE